MCILSRISVWAKVVDMTAVGLLRFSTNPGSDLNHVQDCYETWWHVKLPYWDVHIVRNLCLGKILEMTAVGLRRYLGSEALSATP